MDVLGKLRSDTLRGLYAIGVGEIGVWDEERAKLVSSWKGMSPTITTSDLMDLLQRTDRLMKIKAAGQLGNAELKEQIETLCPTTWEHEPYLPFQGKQKSVAEQLIKSVELAPGDDLFLDSSMPSRGVSEHIMEHCLQNGVYPRLDVQDRDFLRVLMAACTPEQAAAVGQLKGEKRMASSKLLFAVQDYPVSDEINAVIDPQDIHEQSTAYGAKMSEAQQYTKGRDIRYCLTFIPTPHEAEQDGMEYEAYLKLFFELCDQPWKPLQAAQANLIQAFNRCEGFHATNDDGTDVRMSIKDFQFANSVVARNLPGSEIYSAPEKDSVNGTIVAKGKFSAPGSGEVIEDISLTLRDGVIVEYDAAKNKPALDAFFARHPDNKRIGELGIGTNPWLDRHVINGLLVEKVGGSFHLALGHCYQNDYLGEKVRMDNGNNASPDHWDMTTMLKDHGGQMFLTDEKGKEHLVQDNGEWLAVPELGIEQKHVDVLNKGWQALREAGKPIPKEWEKLLDERYGAPEKAAGRG